MLAARRTARVLGRMIFLTVSISTINGINASGVPSGTRWENINSVRVNHPYSINDAQNGRARVRVIVKCLVLVNTYGKSPKKLLNTMNLNSPTNIIDLPLSFGVNRMENSL